ncbi:MAG: NAD(P)-dependent oxidoreductase [Armatimonadetes bacterium]|nr:NAD(P)-dependent oxidoreductase [Armatimonadota bacterium]
MSLSVIVTGAAGHLGSHLTPLLIEAGFEVRGADMLRPATPLPEGCPFLQADLSDADAARRAVEGADIVAHCASIHPWKSYTDAQYLDANIKGTWHLYTAAARAGIERIVLTSSIAAGGYQNIPTDAWPVDEESQFVPGDLYSLTKHAQEDTARLFAGSGKIRTLALRPPAFFPLPPLETGFSLTGAFARVEDIAAAHLAAVRVMAGQQTPGSPLRPFEAVHVTNRLPYRPEDAALLGPGGNNCPLVEKYWPESYPWLVSRGFKGSWLPAVYNLTRAKRLLDWEPACNFEEWLAEQREENRSETPC